MTTVITISNSNDLPLSFKSIAGKTFFVKETKTVDFASGPQTYYIVKADGNIYEVPERFLMPDAENPNYIFSMTATSLLSAIAKGEIDPVALAKKELSNRGLDIAGKWVGFGK